MHKIVVGGIFNELHKGHKALLDKAIELTQFYDSLLIVTITEDLMSVFKSHPVNKYEKRVDNVRQYILSKPNYPLFTFYEYSSHWSEKLWKIFEGNEPITLVCSEETLKSSLEVNKQLYDANKYNDEGEIYHPATIVMIPIIESNDDERISTTRIYKGEIDKEGNTLNQNI